MAYFERPPPPSLRGLAECAWIVVAEEGERADVLPDGCMDLVWAGSALLVAGPDTGPQAAERAVGGVAAGLRFLPGVLPSLLGVPAHALRDHRVPLAELHPVLARRVTPALAGGEPALPLLHDLALRLPGPPPDGTVTALTARLGGPHAPPGAPADDPADDPAGARVPPARGTVQRRVAPSSGPVRPAAASLLGTEPSAAAVADALGVTTRTLHRRCFDAFGYGPAVLRRVLRFRRAVALLQAGRPLAEVAARAGYADQPHLSREVRALAGATPGQLASGANRSTPLPSGSSTTA